MKYFLSIDQGTTGTTAVLLDESCTEIRGKVNQEFKQHFPRPGLVEHDLLEIWQTVRSSTLSVMEKLGAAPSDILAIGITNQRETTCAFDSKGNPLARAIVWQDKRTIDHCEDLKQKGHEKLVRELTGLPIDPYFSATKMAYLLKELQNPKDILFGTIDSFLMYRLTGYKSFKTDTTNASRTLLMGLKGLEYSEDLLNIFQIPRGSLPEIHPGVGEFGKTKGLDFLPDGIPVSGVLGDQQAALFGQGGLNKGDAKCTYGTGAFALANTGETLIHSKSGLLTTVAYSTADSNFYALEGSSFIAGAAVQWLRDNLQIIKNAADIEALALEVTDLDELKYLLFLPFFSGLGSPHWCPEGKAALTGMTRDTNRSHIARATLEGICFAINDLLGAMKNDMGAFKSIRVDGGAVKNELLLQTQATISDMSIIRPEIIETTAYGAGLAAALGVGALKMQDIKKTWKKNAEFAPVPEWKNFYTHKKDLWKSSVEKLYL